LQVDKKKI
jgi:hypothetical protein